MATKGHETPPDLTEPSAPNAADGTSGIPAAPRRNWNRLIGGLAYALMFFFWAVAAGLSAQGLIGFGFDNMELATPWPYLLFFALDGAAGMCMVLLMRRASRNEGATVLRVTVWGLVGASSWFNYTHAPDNPGAHLAYALFPAIGGLLFEFAIHEIRHQAGDASRRMRVIRWLHPIERIRVQAELATDEALTAQQATHRVRVARAAHHLYRLRLRQAGNGWAWVTHRIERRAQAALARAGFAEEDVAREVLRAFQVLAQTSVLADLDLTSPNAALIALDNLIDDHGQPRESIPALAADAPLQLPRVDPEDRNGLLVYDGQFHHSTCVLVMGVDAPVLVQDVGAGLARGLQPCPLCFSDPDFTPDGERTGRQRTGQTSGLEVRTPDRLSGRADSADRMSGRADFQRTEERTGLEGLVIEQRTPPSEDFVGQPVGTTPSGMRAARPDRAADGERTAPEDSEQSAEGKTDLRTLFFAALTRHNGNVNDACAELGEQAPKRSYAYELRKLWVKEQITGLRHLTVMNGSGLR